MKSPLKVLEGRWHFLLPEHFPKVIGYAKVIDILEMNNQPIAFLLTEGNDIYHVGQGTCFLSYTYSYPNDGRVVANGVYLHKEPKDILRRAVALFSARSLPKHNWINDNNRFIGRGCP